MDDGNGWASNFNDTKLLTCGAVESKERGTERLTETWEILGKEEVLTYDNNTRRRPAKFQQKSLGEIGALQRCT